MSVVPTHALELRLLAASRVADVVQAIEADLTTCAPMHAVRVLWWVQGLDSLCTRDGWARPREREAVQQALAADPAGHALMLSSAHVPSGAVLLLDGPAPPALRERTAQLAPYIDCLLEKSLLRMSVDRLSRAEKLQRALFEIADMAGSDLDMDSLLRGVHHIVGGLMYAANFYIALHDARDDAVRFIYFADTHSAEWNTPSLIDRMADIERSLTWYLIRDGRPLRGDDAALRQQVSGPLEIIGPPAADWLGVPMMRNGRVRGALVVQSYDEPSQYSVEDEKLLTYVGGQVLEALERKQARDDLEVRTRELAEEVKVRTQVERRLKHEVLHDALTGLPNRGYLRDQLRRALRRQQREPGTRLAVLYMDLDGFKQVNDREGHLVGDALLSEVATRFASAARGGEVVARLGGDEFAVLMEGVRDPRAPEALAQRLIDALHEPIEVEGRRLRTGTSVGIALADAHHHTPDDVLRDADQAMYAAKAAGRGRVALHDPAMDAPAVARPARQHAH